jgi:hypothetical protein
VANNAKALKFGNTLMHYLIIGVYACYDMISDGRTGDTKGAAP